MDSQSMFILACLIVTAISVAQMWRKRHAQEELRQRRTEFNALQRKAYETIIEKGK